MDEKTLTFNIVRQQVLRVSYQPYKANEPQVLTVYKIAIRARSRQKV